MRLENWRLHLAAAVALMLVLAVAAVGGADPKEVAQSLAAEQEAEDGVGATRRRPQAFCRRRRPKLLLLDEPSSGIAQKETEALGPLLRRLASWGRPWC